MTPHSIRQKPTATVSTANSIAQLPWRQQTAAWGWQLWTSCMGTGAVSTLVDGIPYSFRGQHIIATVFLIIALLLFVVNCIATVHRMRWHPKAFHHSFYSQTEGVYFPCANISIATLLLGIMNVGFSHTGPWLVITCEVIFWIYVAMSVCTGLIVENTLRTIPRSLEDIAPTDCLELYPLMLAGTLGSVLASELAPERAIVVIVISYILQGIGFWLGVLKLSAWMVHHMIMERVPSKVLPSYMIALGPPGFTALSLINLGTAALKVFPEVGFLGGSSTTAGQDFFTAGVWFSLFLLGWCLWIFLQHFGWLVITLFNMIVQRDPLKHEDYSLSWWSWTFPLSGCLSAIGKLATLMPSKALGVIHITGTLFVFVMWLANMYGTGHILLTGQLPAPPKEWDEIRRREESKDANNAQV